MYLISDCLVTLHPVEVGLKTEARIINEIVQLGLPVLLPFGPNHRYDLVVDVAGTFVRIQCKTGRVRDGCIVFNSQSVRTNTRGTFPRGYAGEADLFAVAGPGMSSVYALAVDDAAKASCRLRLTPTANNQARGVRWAKDHLLADVLAGVAQLVEQPICNR